MEQRLVLTKDCELKVGVRSRGATEEEVQRPAAGDAPRRAEAAHEGADRGRHLRWVRKSHVLLLTPGCESADSAIGNANMQTRDLTASRAVIESVKESVRVR